MPPRWSARPFAWPRDSTGGNRPMGRLSNRVAIVTGGAHGIGAATCEMMAREGAAVAVTDVADAEGEDLAAGIRDGGGSARYWRLDVSDEAAVERVFAEVAEAFGHLDTLVSNAGISGQSKPTHEITAEEWDEVMDVNVRGAFFCTKHAIAHLRRAGGGSIVNLSSIYGIVGAEDIPPYHASKGAIRLMTKTDALLYAGDGIRVNSVHPGFIWTPLVEKMAADSEEGVEGFREKLDSLHPLGHVGEPEDIAQGIAYLASDAAKFVTGSELVIDGGYTAR